MGDYLRQMVEETNMLSVEMLEYYLEKTRKDPISKILISFYTEEELEKLSQKNKKYNVFSQMLGDPIFEENNFKKFDKKMLMKAYEEK